MSFGNTDPGRATLGEYEAYVEPEEYNSELSQGLLVREPRPGWYHQTIASRIYDSLKAFVADHQLGAVYFEVGYRLAVEPPTVRGPDVSFIRAERLPAALPRSGFVPFAPDLAIEIVSPSNSAADLQTKVLEFFAAGTSQVWIVDPINGVAMIYRSLIDIALIRAPASIDGGALLPGFTLSLESLFR